MKIALGIPHTPWIPERDKSLTRLLKQIPPDHDFELKLFTEKKPNREWARDMWKWAYDTGADFFLTLQDDVLVAPDFWKALSALLVHLPKGQVLGLSSVHGAQREIERRGHRWYRTQSWTVGWAYGMWREDLEELIEFDDQTSANPELVKKTEDSFVNHWIIQSGRSSWHPVPTIVDHDTSIVSSYGNDTHNHRRPSVTWRGYKLEELTDPDFWIPSGEPTLLPNPRDYHCWFCFERPPIAASPAGVSICNVCVANITSQMLVRVTT